MAAVIKTGIQWAPDRAQLIRVQNGEDALPAVVWSQRLMGSLMEWHKNSRTSEHFSELVEKRQSSIEERIAELDVRMASLRQRQNRRSEVEARLRKLHRESSKLKDERDYLATFIDRLDEDADDAQGRLAEDLLSKVTRSRLSQPSTDQLVKSAFDTMFDAYVVDQAQDDSSRTSEESSGAYSPSVILSEFNHYFRKVADARKDEQGRLAEEKIQAYAVMRWLDGYEMPPTAVIDSRALVAASSAIRSLIVTEKECRCWRRRALRQRIQLDQHFIDDSDILVSEPETAHSSDPADGTSPACRLRQRRNGRRFRDDLPDHFEGPEIVPTPPASAKHVDLASQSWGSHRSVPDDWDDHSAEKRIMLWQRLQRRRTAASLKDRARREEPLKVRRAFAPRVNKWMMKNPDDFRWTNCKRRKPEPVDASSLDSSEDGKFLHWNQKYDPGETPSHSSLSSLEKPVESVQGRR